MRVRRVEPRGFGWEVDQPTYRVCFWTRPAHSNAAPTPTEFDLTDTDVGEALTWARRTAGNRVFVLYAVCDVGGRLGLVRLAGEDPTRTASRPATWPGPLSVARGW